MKSVSPILFTLVVLVLLAGCTRSQTESNTSESRASGSAPPDSVATFRDDVSFLRKHGGVEVLKGAGGGRIAVSPRYQGRVMTSGIAPDGRSFGWVNRSFVRGGKTGTPFDNYGGEDRFWLGPEGGQYGLYFPPGSAFTLDNWQVPPALNEGKWSVEAQSDESMTLTRSMQVSNYQDTRFAMDVRRTVRMLSESDIGDHFDVSVPDAVQWVGFETINEVTNTGAEPWTASSGLPSIWILGQFETFHSTTRIVVPYDEEGSGPIVNDDYFQSLSNDRLVATDGYIVYKADGKYRSKIGVGPRRAQSMFSSYDPEAQVLTLIQYKKPAGVTEYVNSLWKQQDQPYGGDVINAYNDSPTDAGGSSFYELESSSPALDLAPGESYTHFHRTLHLVGPADMLRRLLEETLGVSEATVTTALK